jgi:hypothetical protein
MERPPDELRHIRDDGRGSQGECATAHHHCGRQWTVRDSADECDQQHLDQRRRDRLTSHKDAAGRKCASGLVDIDDAALHLAAASMRSVTRSFKRIGRGRREVDPGDIAHRACPAAIRLGFRARPWRGMLQTWVLTVPSVIPSATAISRFRFPRTTCCSTSELALRQLPSRN